MNALLFLALSLSAQATEATDQATEKTTLEFRLFAEEYGREGPGKTVFLSTLNSALKRRGLPGFADIGVFGKDDKPYARLIKKRVEEASRALGRNIKWFSGNNGGHFFEFPTICYRGKPSEVRAIIEGLAGEIFSYELTVLAYRHGKFQKVTWEDEFFGTNPELREEQEESYAGLMKKWDNYDPRSDTVLFITNYGISGDGTELDFAEIKRCK